MRIHQAIHGEEDSSAQNSKFKTLLRVHLRYNRVELKESEKHRMFFLWWGKVPSDEMGFQLSWILYVILYIVS